MASSLAENPQEDVRGRSEEEASVADAPISTVVLTDRPSNLPARLWSPRLAHPEQVAYFAKQLILLDLAPD